MPSDPTPVARSNVIPLPGAKLLQRRASYELEFLPAALEIIETPASPAGRAVMATISALILIAVIWASFGRVDIIVTSQGRIIPSGKVKEIQPFEIGVVKAIPVKDGQHVAAGEVLVALDPTTNAADVEKTARDLMHARLDEARLSGLLDPGAPDGFAALHDADPSEVMTALSQMQAQSREQAAKLDAIDHQLAQKRAELAGVHATIDKLEASMPMIQSRYDIRESLLHIEYGNKIDYLTAKQALSEQQHDLQVQQLKTSEIGQAIEALEKQRLQTIEEFRKTALVDLSKAEAQIAELSQEAIKYAQKAELQTLRAPVAGTVQQLAVHTIGGVVTPAQTLLVLVPDDAKLEIEADIPNRDVGFVHEGQPVEIKVDAFTVTRYGLLHGTVVTVSRDATTRSAGDRSAKQTKPSEPDDDATDPAKSSTYVARVSLDRSWIETEQGHNELGPGMAVTAEIKTGRRRVISYLLSPLTRYRHEAGRER